jgi:hypothetical protein
MVQLLYDRYVEHLREEVDWLKQLVKQFIEGVAHHEQLSIVHVLNKLCLSLPPPEHESRR